MSPLTDVRNEISKAIESADVPKPLYAVAGVGGLAVEKLRDAEQRVRALHIEQRVAGLGDGARALPGKVQTLPATVVNAALSAGDRAGTVYTDLSERGKQLVDGWTAVTITDAPAKRAEDPASKSAATKTSTAKTSTAKSGTKSTAAKSNGTATKTAGKSTAKKS